MTCPTCKLENPPGASTCDCGFDFDRGRRDVRADTRGPDRAFSVGHFFTTLLWAVSALAAIVAGYQLFDAASNSKSAPQQGAGAAIALGLAIIPYCAARALEKIIGSRR